MHAQSYPALFDPMDCTLPDSSAHGISKQEYWGGLSFPSPGDLPDPGIKPVSPVSPTLAGRFFTTAPGKPQPLLNLPGMNVKLASYSTPAPQGCQNYLPKEQI